MRNFYKPADFFMFRFPCLPYQVFFDVACAKSYKEKMLEYLESNNFFKLAIYISNPKFYVELGNISKKSEKQKNQIYQTLLKYLIRMTTRATPYGLFAPVSAGKFVELPKYTFEGSQKLALYCRPDMQFVYELINQFELDDEILKKCNIKRNTFLNIIDKQVINYFYRDVKKQKIIELSVKNTSLLRIILDLSSEWISYFNLLNKTIKAFPNYDKESISLFLFTLIEKQILVTNLNANLFDNNPFNQLLEKIAPLTNSSVFQNISTKCISFNKRKKNLSIKSLEEIEVTIRKSLPSFTKNNSIHVDAVSKGKVELPRNVAEEACKAFEIINKIKLIENESSNVEDYYWKFISKYGYDSKVSILTLLNENGGLGFPINSKDFQQKRTQKNYEWDRFIINKCLEAIKTDTNEVILRESEVNGFLPQNYSVEKFPVSASIFCEVMSESLSDISNGEFELLLSPNKCCETALGVFGRFTYLFDLNFQTEIKLASEKEGQLRADYEEVELSWLPSFGGAANIAIHTNFQNYHLTVPPINDSKINKKSLAIEDISLLATKEGFSFYSEKLQKKIHFKFSNAINIKLAPRIITFLKEVSDSRYHDINGFNFASLKDFNYLPAFLYNKTYLSPRTWRFYLEKDEADFEKVLNKFIQQQKVWKLPRYVCIGLYDNFLLIDSENKEHLNLLVKEFLTRREIIIYEKISFYKWLLSEGKHYLGEFVIPILSEQKDKEDQETYFIKNHDSKNYLNSEDNKWIYFKLFCHRDWQNKFIVDHLVKFTNNLILEKQVEQWFFIRYHDPDDHIRLRIKIQNRAHKNLIVNEIENWAKGLIFQSVISDFSIHNYCREFNRYGGNKLIDLAEVFFFYDSMCVSLLLKNMQLEKFDLPLIAIGCVGIVNLLLSIGFSEEKSANFLSPTKLNNNDLSGFRKLKPKILESCKSFLYNEFKDGSLLNTVFSIRKESLKAYLNDVEIDTEFSQRVNYIINSLIHMFCNRLGITNDEEEQSRFFAFKTLQTLNFLKYV